ncbi:RmlC-like cupin domain-containing protein [Pyronema omphalodes]|nr:RmlC-like cupin domain-containing protein [Pyronema omphalodes]
MPIPLPPSPTEKKASLCTRIPRGELCRTHSNPNLKADNNRFLALRDEINRILGPSSGIDSNDVSVDDIMNAMKQYISSEKDWNSFALSDPSRNYTRNFVDHGNGKANLLLLVWNPGKASLPHDHAGAHCIMKVLKGSLRETLYNIPEATAENKQQPLSVRKTTLYGTDEVTYISDDIGLHKIENASSTEIAVSLHLYTPPYAEKNGCHAFDVKTGKKTKVEMCTYYSLYGQRNVTQEAKGRSC